MNVRRLLAAAILATAARLAVAQSTGHTWEPLFDINTIPVADIEAVEYYASAAETPSKYATLDSQCGVLVIHTLRFHPKDTTAAGGKPPR